MTDSTPQEAQKDHPEGFIDVMKLVKDSQATPPDPYDPSKFYVDDEGNQISLEVGKNCYKVSGIFVPTIHGTRLMVMCEGKPLAPKEFLQHIQAMGQSVMQQVKQSASRLHVAAEIPKHGGTKRG